MFLIPEGVATLLAPMMPLQKPAQNYNNPTQITKPKKSLRSHTLILFNAKQQKRKVSQNLFLIGICSKNTFKLQKLKKNIYGHSMQVCHLYKNKHRHSVTPFFAHHFQEQTFTLPPQSAHPQNPIAALRLFHRQYTLELLNLWLLWYHHVVFCFALPSDEQFA